MSQTNYTIGLDFGTDSVRALVVSVETGDEVATSVQYYKRWSEGKYCNAHLNQFRQHPQDYIDGMIAAINEALESSQVADKIVGIGVDTTGSTPCPVDATGTPLALLDGFQENPNAMFHLWKDHTAVDEAKKINQLNKDSEIDYLRYVGGIYSSEWYWAKIAHTNGLDHKVRESAFTWVEHCDWIPFLLTGGNDATQLKRSVCAAGHKALWHKDFEGVPPLDFLAQIEPSLGEFKTELLEHTYSSDEVAGYLSAEWANILGLSTNVIVAIGAYDAHMGAVGGEIAPGYLSKVIGTSTCDIMVVPLSEQEHLVKGICGQVNGSVIPGMLGLEAGQSAFGDVYAWFKNVLAWPFGLLNKDESHTVLEEIDALIIPRLAEAASQIPPSSADPVALDWMNGRRTPDANQTLKGAITGINLGTDAPRIFKSLVEATCFGARKIVDRFKEEGINVDGVIALGGVAKKSPYIMQVLSDVLQMPIKIGKSEQTCALGAAMFAAVAAGKFDTVNQAMKAMGAGFEKTYTPNTSRAEVYEQLYTHYCDLGEQMEKLT